MHVCSGRNLRRNAGEIAVSVRNSSGSSSHKTLGDHSEPFAHKQASGNAIKIGA
jgi:hypothetical protein